MSNTYFATIKILPFSYLQVKLFIFEARNLDGYDYHPVCGALLLDSSQYTQPCKSTSNPIWNQSMQLSVYATPTQLFSSSLNIVVRILPFYTLRCN